MFIIYSSNGFAAVSISVSENDGRKGYRLKIKAAESAHRDTTDGLHASIRTVPVERYHSGNCRGKS
ncbi:hypothetical protein NMH_1050 [Neisseria meningitidis H44/76]|uniref:Uncharacterized protein n=2 Tax=Neisseria meningitidis TaxID=487 RepID=E6MWL0_NEIMH|nr:hypothetical protein NMH_1050 [Neisseria meningitidis H44/76]